MIFGFGHVWIYFVEWPKNHHPTACIFYRVHAVGAPTVQEEGGQSSILRGHAVACSTGGWGESQSGLDIVPRLGLQPQ